MTVRNSRDRAGDLWTWVSRQVISIRDVREVKMINGGGMKRGSSSTGSSART